MATIWDDRLAEVWAEPGKAGAGVVVGAEAVLTARHVVEGSLDGGTILGRLVKPGAATAAWIPMTVLAEDRDWDVTLLGVDRSSGGTSGPEWLQPTSPSPVFVRLGTSAEHRCEAVGFPQSEVQPTPDGTVRQSEQAVGILLAAGQAKGPVTPDRPLPRRWMPFDVTESTPGTQAGWGGMSGAGVVLSDGRLAGLVVAAEAGHQQRRLYMVPFSDMVAGSSRIAEALSAALGGPVVIQVRDARLYRDVLEDDCLAPDGMPVRVDQASYQAFGVKLAGLPGEPDFLSYVPRDGDQELRDGLQTARGEHRMLLVVGGSAGGKSRSAAEAARLYLADHRLLCPRQMSLARVRELPVADWGATLAWLNDAERYEERAFKDSVDWLLHSGVNVVATIRDTELDHRLPKGDLSNLLGKALTDSNLVVTVFWPVKWSDQELARVNKHVSYPALLEWAAAGRSPSAWVVAGPDLQYKLDRAKKDDERPVRYQVVQMVLDWYRTGIARPMPATAVPDLIHAYLQDEDEADPDEVSEALQWGCEPVIGAARRTRQSLLAMTRTGDAITVHDYIQDADARAGERDVPDVVWTAALKKTEELDEATPNSARRFTVGLTARVQGNTDVALKAWQPLAAEGDAAAAVYLGILRYERREDDAAKAAYQQAIDSGHPEWAPMAAFNLGILLKDRGERDRGEVDAAEAAFQRAIDSGHPEWAPAAAYVLGIFLKDRREVGAAKAAFQRAIDSDHADVAPMAAYDLGVLLKDQGEIDAAEAAFQWAIDSDHPEAAPTATVKLGILLHKRGETGAANDAFQRAIDSRHLDMAPTAAVNLGVLLYERGKIDRAKAAFQRAIDSYHPRVAPTAAADLGILLYEQGEIDAARAAYQRAIDPRHPDVAPAAAVNLRTLLQQLGEVGATKSTYQQAIDPDRPDWSPTAAVNLGSLLHERGEIGAAKAAHEQATGPSQPGMRVERVTPLVIWAERTRAATLTRYFGRDSAFRRNYQISVHVKPFDNTEDLEDAFSELAHNGQLPRGHQVRPDIVVGPHDWIGRVASEGSVADPLPIPNERYTFDRKALGALRQGGRLYALPYLFDSVALIRNDALAGHGDMPKKIDDLVEAGQDALRAGGIDGGLPLALQVGKPNERGDAGDPYHLWPLFASVGGTFFGLRTQVTDDGGEPVEIFGDQHSWKEGFVNAFVQIARLGVGPGGGKVLDPNISRAQALAEFLRGRAPYLICSSRGLQAIKEQGMEVTVGAVPQLGLDIAQPLVSVYGFFICQGAPNLSAARNLLSSYLANPQAGLDLNKIQPLVPVQPGAMTHLADQDDLLRAYIDQCRTGMIMPSYPEMRKAWQLLGMTEYRVLAGDGNPRDVAAAAADQAREILPRPSI